MSQQEERGPRVLIVRRRYLGDTVLMEPFVRNLRAHWPAARISMVVDTPYVEALADVPALDRILELPAGHLHVDTRVRKWSKLVRAVAGRPWDVVFDFAHNEQAQTLVLLSRAPRRVVHVQPGARLHLGELYTDVVASAPADGAARHAVDDVNRALEALGVPTPFRIPTLPVAADARRAARALLGTILDGGSGSGGGPAVGSTGPLLLVHPGSGAPARRWPPADFARVADLAVRCHGARVVVLGGPGEEGLASAVAAAMTEAAATLPTPPGVRVLGALLAEADLFLGNDSGPMHLAAAVGTPVCALFGSESVVRWGPLGDAGHRAFHPELPCGTACVNAGACRPDDPMKTWCIRRIPTDEVIRAVCAQLAASKRDALRRATKTG